MKSIQEILSSNAVFVGFADKAKTVRELNQLFHEVIEFDMKETCRITKYENGQLHILVNNSSLATRLRFLIPEIIKTLRTQAEFKDLEKIKYFLKRY